MAGVGVAAALAGGSLAWRRLQPHDVQPDWRQVLWQQPMLTLDGQQATLAVWRGKPLLINFWATWCPPCIRELPMLSNFAQKQAEHGLQVVGLAIDKAEAVRKFLGRQPVQFPVLLIAEGGLELTRVLGNTEGGLPFSVLINAGGHVRQRRIGELSADDLALWSQKS